MSSFDYHINSREVRRETGRVKDDFRLALESLAQSNHLEGLSDALDKLSTNPLTQRERAQKVILDALTSLKLPFCTLDEYKVRYLQFQSDCVERENRRKQEAETEILRQNSEQIARGVAGTVYQIPPSADGSGGGLAGVGQPFFPPLLHPSLAVPDYNLPRLGADPWTTTKSVTRGIDFHTLQPLPRPLCFIYEIDLSYFENDIIFIPALDTIDLQKSILRCIKRCEDLGCDHAQTIEFFLKLLKKYHPAMYYALHPLTEYERFCTEFSRMVSIHDYSHQIEASLAKVTRQPSETIQAVALRWRDLQALKFRYKMGHLSVAEQERKAQNSVLEDIGIFMSNDGAAMYKDWLKNRRKDGEKPTWEDSLEQINIIEENDRFRLTSAKVMDMSVLKRVQAYSTAARQSSQYAGSASGAGVGGQVSSWSSPASGMYSGRNSPARDRRSPSRRSPNRSADINATRYENPSPHRGDRYYRNYPSTSSPSRENRSPGRQSGRSGSPGRSPGGRGRDYQRDGRREGGARRYPSEERRRERYDLREKIDQRRSGRSPGRSSAGRSSYRPDSRPGRGGTGKDNNRRQSGDRYKDNNRARDKSGRFLSRSPGGRSYSQPRDSRGSGRDYSRDDRRSSPRGRAPSGGRAPSRPGSRNSSQPRRSPNSKSPSRPPPSNKSRQSSWDRSPGRKGRQLQEEFANFRKQSNPRLGDKRSQKN